MSDLIILGTDTDVGKTTFALLWMSAFADRYEYWKPVETGPSDSEQVRQLVPKAIVHPPCERFEAAVAPPLAAQMEGKRCRGMFGVIRAKPAPTALDRRLLVESFGSPFSPLDERCLQHMLLRALGSCRVLISSSRLGAVGRTVQCLAALRGQGLQTRAVVLLGPADEYAAQEIQRHSETQVFSLRAPESYDTEAIRQCATAQRQDLVALELHLGFALASEDHTPLADPIAKDQLARDASVIWHPYTPLAGADRPLVCSAARDEFLSLADGRHVIDAISSWWTILHGHCHPPLMNALASNAEYIDHVHFAGVTHYWPIRLAEWLLRAFPWKGGRVFYSDNGSTAVEVALKMAYQFWCHQGEPQRTRFVGFDHGYHGDTFGAMAVSRDPLFFGRFEPLLLQADILPIDPDRLDDHLSKYRDQVAGIIIEPLVQGAGGMRMHTPQTLRAIAEVTQRHDVLFIADEVMTGSGRTGTLWAHQAAGIMPDLVCAAKTLAGGVLPLAATLVSPRVVKAFETADRSKTFFHGHSFTAHPLACAVACANAELLDRPETLAKPQAMATFWTETVEPLRFQARVKDVRIRGSIAAVELDVEGGYLADVGRRLRQVCLEAGVLIRPLGNVLYAMPPFGTRPESLQQMGDAMRRAVLSAHV